MRRCAPWTSSCSWMRRWGTLDMPHAGLLRERAAGGLPYQGAGLPVAFDGKILPIGVYSLAFDVWQDPVRLNWVS